MSQTEGGLNVSLRDLARFGELHRCNGEAHGRQILPSGWVEELRVGADIGSGSQFGWSIAVAEDLLVVGQPGTAFQSGQAVTYRRVEKISGLDGTAVNICQMVFGNMGDDSGTGVCFTRDPSSGGMGSRLNATSSRLKKIDMFSTQYPTSWVLKSPP